MLRSTDPKVNTYVAFMPPLVATKDEAQDLATYLATLKPAAPAE